MTDVADMLGVGTKNPGSAVLTLASFGGKQGTAAPSTTTSKPKGMSREVL